MLETQLNNYQFQYQEKGTGNPLVLVHGSASDYRTWENQLEEFGKHYRTIAYSRRYHWPNEKIPDEADYSMLQHVDDLKAFLQSLGNDPVHLVGHSYGGFVCLLLALRNPQLIRSLVLAEPPVVTLYVSDPPKPVELLKLLFTKPGTFITLIKFASTGLGPAVAAAKRNNMDKALEIFGKATLGADYYDNLSESRQEQARANVIKAEFLGSGLPPLDEKKIRRIELPVLLLKGEKSPKLFRLLADRLHELIPHAERKTIPGTSHIMHEDNATDYNSTLHLFLEKH